MKLVLRSCHLSRHKPGLSLGQAGLALCKNEGLFQGQPGFVPGTSRGSSLGQSRGRPKGDQNNKFMFMCHFLAWYFASCITGRVSEIVTNLSQIRRSISDNFVQIWEKLNRGVPKTLSGLFLVGAVLWRRKRKGTNREDPRTIPGQTGKIPEESGKDKKGQKKTKKQGRVQIEKPPPRLKPPL